MTLLQYRAHDSLTGWFSRDEPSPQAPASGYMTLIPLSDARLQPPNAGLSVLHFVVFAAIVASAVFILVPRGISIGSISVHAGMLYRSECFLLDIKLAMNYCRLFCNFVRLFLLIFLNFNLQIKSLGIQPNIRINLG